MQRTNYCGVIDSQYLNQQVRIKGWVHRHRNLGGLIFFDLRDREGLLQIVANPESSCFKISESLKHEYVVEVIGKVRARPNVNKELKNGDVEIVAEEIQILNTSLPIPILIDDETTSEANRLLHRVIDLRSSKMQHNLRLRYKTSMEVRKFLDELGFIDIETPMLTRSTPEGARDFLVPSRINKGSFYALPQSPQLFKQLLMVSGFDRYYQIIKCFRDEDLRADRQPEFTQIDIETSFLVEQEIQDIAEKMVCRVFKNILNITLPEFPTLTYNDAIYYYGSDKPDLRNPLKFVDLTNQLKNCEFKAFSNAANLTNGRIVALVLPNNINLSRKKIDEYAQFCTIYGSKGLAYIKVNSLEASFKDGLQSPITKFLTQAELKAILDNCKVKTGETILFCADKAKIVNESMGALRLKIGQEYNLFTTEWAPLWVVDFPMFEYDEEIDRYIACHHPFTSPKEEHLELLTTNPEKCLAKAYDLVLNGWELGGGSIRIYKQDLQNKIFKTLKISDEEAKDKFGFLLDNLQFGAPPHGGIAFGLDRLVTLMCKAESIRDVIAFPKTTSGQCLLTNAPNKIDNTQLVELGIKNLINFI